MAGDELPEPVAEKEASHEAIDVQAISGSISIENLKEQMEIKSNVLDVNIVNGDGDIVKEEEVPYKLGICEQNQIITEKPENLEKSLVNLEQEVPEKEKNSSPVEKPNAEEQDKLNGETEDELHSTQFSEESSPELVKGDEIPPNGIPLLSEEIQEKTDSEEVTKKISDEDETEKDAIQSSSVAILSNNDNQKDLEIPLGNASENPEVITNEVDVPSSTTPLVADEVSEEANGKKDVSEEVQKEQIDQIETPKEDLAEVKECRDETKDQSKDVPLAASLEETIPEETSQENQTPEMTCEENERNEETTLKNKMDETSRIDNEETIPDEVSISYDQSIANEETSKRDEGSENKSEDVKMDDVAETATPLILEVAKVSADIKEDATEEAHQNQISNEDGTDKDAGQSTSVIELSESDDPNEKANGNESTNPEEEVTKELDLKEDESPSSVQEEILEEAKEKVDVVEVHNEQNFEEVKPEDNIVMGEKEETMQNENEENAEESSHQDITIEETGKINEETEHISDESTLETVTTRDVAPEIDIKDVEMKALTNETDNRDIEKIEEKNEEISVEVDPSESSDAPMKIEEASLNECKEEKSEEHEKLEHQETDDEKEVESYLEIKEQLDESKPSPSEEEECAERDIVETKPLNETEEGEENLDQNEIPSKSKETNGEDEEEICDEKSTEVSEMPIHDENNANEGTDGDQIVEVKDQDDEAAKENIEEISEPTEASNDTGALIDTEISSEKVELLSENIVSSQLLTNEEFELQNENAASSQLATSEEVLPEVPSESTTISETKKEDKRNEVLYSKTENMEIESSNEDDLNKRQNSEAECSAEVTEAPEEDLRDRTSDRSYEQVQVVPEKATEGDDLTSSTYGNEIETEKPEIANSSNQDQEENSVIPQKDDESVLEVKHEEETKDETLEKLLLEKATEEDSLIIASNDNEIETEKPEIGEALSQVQDDKIVIPNDNESMLEVKPEEETEVEILENEQITQTLEEVDEPCITQNKEELPEAENAIESKEIPTNSSISTIQQKQQSEDSDANPTEANQTTDDISKKGGMEINATLISGIEQIDERSIAKEEEVTKQVENTVVPDEETKGETEKQIEEIPQIIAPSEVTEVELGQSEIGAPVTENLEVVSNEKSGADTKFTDLDAKPAELGSPTNESLAQKDTSIETSNAREFQFDSTEFTTKQDEANQESDVKPAEPDQAADEIFAVKNLEDNATLSETIEQTGEVEGLVANDGKYTNNVIPQNVDGSESEVKVKEETIDETQTNEDITQKLEDVDEEPCITQNKEELPEAENIIENNDTSTDFGISTLQGDQQSEESDVKPSDADQATGIISEEECLKINATLTSSIEEINERSIAKEEETTTQEENSVVEKLKEENEGESAGKQIEQVNEVELSQSEIVAPETEKLEVIPNEKFGEASEPTDAHSKPYELESTIDELVERKETFVEQIDERSIMKEQEATIQEQNIIVETQKGEAEGESTEEKMEQIPEITDPSDITEIEINQCEIVAPETENVEVVSNEKSDNESKSTETDAKSADLESTTVESTEQKEISTEPSNSREVQIETENITVPDQQSQGSDVKPTEVDQVTDEDSAVVNSEDNAILSASVEQIGEVKEFIAKEESVNLQEEDDVVARMPEEEAEKIEGANNNQMKEEAPQITNPSEFTEAELNQSEFVAPETESMEAISDQKFGDETKLTETYATSSELEPINTREVQIDQTEITTQQDQLNQISDTKPTEPDQEIDRVSEVENSEVNATSSTSIEQTEEAEGLVANKESVVVQEEHVVAEMSEEETDQKVEATNKKHIEEVPQIVHPTEVTEGQLVESEPVGPEAEHSDIVSDQKFGDESGHGETDLRSDQMETMVENPNADLSSSVQQIMERSEENEGLLKSTGEQVHEVVEEPIEKHIDGEFHRIADYEIYDIADEELKTISTEKEVNLLAFEIQTKSVELDKEIEESVLVEEISDTITLVSGEETIEEIESADKESGVLPQSTAELPQQKVSQGVETYEEPSDKDIAGEISEIIHRNEITEVQLVDSETLCLETEQSEFVSNEKLGDESKLDETIVKLAQMGSTSDELIEEKLDANLSSSGEQICEKFEDHEVVLQSTDELVQGEKIDAEVPKEETSEGIEVAEDSCDKHIGEKPDTVMLKEEGSQGIEVAEDPCDKHIEGEILRTVDPEISYAVEESKDVLTEKEIENFGTETESTEKSTEESASVEEKSDATANLVPDEGHVEVESANRESSVVLQRTTESVALPEERVHLETDTSEEQSDKDIAREISKIAVLETHDGAVQSEAMLNEEKVDSEELRTEIESPDLENATNESALVEEKSDDATNLVYGEEKIEEIEIASKESRVSPQSTIESVTKPEENVSEGIETNEEPRDKHIVEEQDNTSVDNFEASKEIKLVQEEKVDQTQTTASPIEQHDSKNDGTEMESAFLESTNDDIDVKENLDASVISIVGAVINRTDNRSESVPTVEDTQSETTELVDVPPETLNSTKTEKLHVKEDTLDIVVSETEEQTKDKDLITWSQKGISGQEKDIAIITSEVVSEEFNAYTNQKGDDQHTENAADQEAIEQRERDIDVTELLKTVEKVAVDETNEDSQENVPNLSEQSKELEEEFKQSEEPEQDFASIVSSFLISKVLSDENQKVDNGIKQNNDASSIPKPLDGETIQEIVTTKTEPETQHEEVLYGTSSRDEAKLQLQEPEEENGEKTVEENEEEDGVEQDYLPVSRFLMDKILRQEENRNLQGEKTTEGTDKHAVNDSGIQKEEKIEETDKDTVNDGGTQIEKKTEEDRHIVLASEQKGETTSSFADLPRDFEKGETLIGKVESTFAGDGAIFIKEKVEENTVVAELTKLEGEGSHSPMEVISDFEKEEKPAEAPKPIEDKNETLVSDVGISSVEKEEGKSSSSAVVAEQEGKSISPIKAISDFEKENESMEQNNEALITGQGISSIENIEENASDMALPKQEKTLNAGEVARDFDDDKKSVEENDDTIVSFDEVKEGGNSKVASEEVEDLAYGEHSKDFIEGALINAQEISNPEEVGEENRIAGTHREEEHKKEVIADEETPKDVKNVEENYVFVEHEANQFEEPKHILKEQKATDEASDATISNLQEKQTNLSGGIQNDKTNLVGQVESSEEGIESSSVSCQDIEQSPSDIPKVPMATEIVKELVDNETEFIHGEERVKEVTDTVVDGIENKSQEKHAEMEGTEIEKKGEDIKSEHEEEERHHEVETEIIGRDLTFKPEARETEMKSAQKKSHNILSGVGSKVKHTLAKVKKAITGKSKNVSPSAK